MRTWKLWLRFVRFRSSETLADLKGKYCKEKECESMRTKKCGFDSIEQRTFGNEKWKESDQK